MVWNDALKRNIPEGWHCGNLFEIAKFTNGLACQKFRPKVGEAALPVIKIREMRDGFTADTEEVTPNIPDSVKVFNGDILFSWSASLEVMLWAFGEGGLNQHIFKVTSANGFPKSFYFYQLLDYVDVFKKMAEARKTTMGHITQDHLQQSTIAIPDDISIADKFEKRISPVFERIVKLQEEISTLSKQRDELLPLLMNGQVSLNSDLSAKMLLFMLNFIAVICAYCIVAIVLHDMRLDRSTYEVLQILSMSLTDTTHLRDLFDKTIFKNDKDRSGSGEPNLFNF